MFLAALGSRLQLPGLSYQVARVSPGVATPLFLGACQQTPYALHAHWAAYNIAIAIPMD